MIDVATLAAALALVKASGGGGSGEPGFSPTVEIAEVEGGTQVTITDVNGPQTFTVLNGTNGTNGANGQDGQDGVSPVLSIGEVTTLAAGSQATASLGGTAANPTLNLGIPQGAQGAQGAPGLDAPQIDDTQITTTNPWSSMQIVKTLCPPFTVSGPIVQCTPVENSPLGVQVEITPTQEGTGDPSPENIRPIVGRNIIRIYQHTPTSTGDLDGLSWREIQNIVRKGIGPTIIPIGYQFTVNHSVYGDKPWIVLGHNVHKNAHNMDSPTMTIGAVPVLGTLPFDAPEAIYYAESQLAAGTYHFTTDGYDKWAAGTYQFTLTQAVPAGGQIVLNGYYDAHQGAFTNAKINTYASRTTTTPIESNVAIIAGSAGTNLGTTGEGNVNHIQRISYGSNNYKESAMRQFLNSASPAAACGFRRPSLTVPRPGSRTRRAS